MRNHHPTREEPLAKVVLAKRLVGGSVLAVPQAEQVDDSRLAQIDFPPRTVVHLRVRAVLFAIAASIAIDRDLWSTAIVDAALLALLFARKARRCNVKASDNLGLG